LEYDHAEAMTWQELFSGFDSIRAITFSSGLSFVYKGTTAQLSENRR
jgi:hypothetical protein